MQLMYATYVNFKKNGNTCSYLMHTQDNVKVIIFQAFLGSFLRSLAAAFREGGWELYS